jgi:hypothetical protein
MASCGHPHLRPRTPLRGAPSNRDSRGRGLRRARHTHFDRAAASTYPSAARPTAAPTSRDSLATCRAASRRRLREQLRAHLRRHRWGQNTETTCPDAAHPRPASACARRTPYDRSEPRSTAACARLYGRHHARRTNCSESPIACRADLTLAGQGACRDTRPSSAATSTMTRCACKCAAAPLPPAPRRSPRCLIAENFADLQFGGFAGEFLADPPEVG